VRPELLPPFLWGCQRGHLRAISVLHGHVNDLLDWNAAFMLSHLCKSPFVRRSTKPKPKPICHCHHGANGICQLTLPSGHLVLLPDFYAVVNPFNTFQVQKDRKEGRIRIWIPSHAVRARMVNSFIVRQRTLETNVDFCAQKRKGFFRGFLCVFASGGDS